MKFVHIADMHFDSPFVKLSDKDILGDLRRLEQRKVFKKIIEYIKNNNIKYFFISGDLYEHKYVRQSTIEYINKLFKEIPETKIFIAPGNHDPYLKNSYYNKFNWNENVKIFNSEIEKIELPEESEYTKKIEYTTTRRDIDLNGHMHNLYYLDLAYEALPEDVYEKRPYDNIQIQYKKEIKYGEKVICKYAYKNNNHIVAIYDEKEKKLHAVVKLQKNYCNY